MVFIPISFGIAILRYHLYDIDILINRTLVYGTLSAILALVYFGLIFALQYLLRGIINQNNDVAIVISTLMIAALFQPLQRRIQTLIDRRFYRRKYDAAKILKAFSASLRTEVDLTMSHCGCGRLNTKRMRTFNTRSQDEQRGIISRPGGCHMAPCHACGMLGIGLQAVVLGVTADAQKKPLARRS